MSVKTAVAACVLGAAVGMAEPVEPVLREAPAGAVRLLDGPFRAARDTHAEYLLGLSADRLLARYRTDAGLEARAAGYGGWEACLCIAG